MANYESMFNTNTFKVTDLERAKSLCKMIQAEYTEFLVHEEESSIEFGGYGFSSLGLEIGMYDDEEEMVIFRDNMFNGDEDEAKLYISNIVKNDDYDYIYREWQKILVEDSPMMILEIGNEKLRYVGGYVIILEKDKLHNIELWDLVRTWHKSFDTQDGLDALKNKILASKDNIVSKVVNKVLKEISDGMTFDNSKVDKIGFKLEFDRPRTKVLELITDLSTGIV